MTPIGHPGAPPHRIPDNDGAELQVDPHRVPHGMTRVEHARSCSCSCGVTSSGAHVHGTPTDCAMHLDLLIEVARRAWQKISQWGTSARAATRIGAHQLTIGAATANRIRTM